MRSILSCALAALVVLGAAASADAAKRTSDTFTFADPFSGSFDCGGFTGTFSGHDRGRVTTWFDQAGDPIMQVGHIHSIETDLNTSTGASVLVRSNLAVHVDFAAGTTAITGSRNMATEPGRGVVVQHVGRVVVGPDGQPISLSGKFAEFVNGYMGEDFCRALTQRAPRSVPKGAVRGSLACSRLRPGAASLPRLGKALG